MSRSSKVPAYCLHKPSGRAYVRIRGRVRYCGEFGTPESKAEYGRLIAEYAASPEASATVPGTITILELIDAYWHHAEAYYRCVDGTPTGHLTSVHAALRVLKHLYGPTPAVEFGPLALRAIQEHMVKAGAARSYVNQHAANIKRAFKWAVSVEMLPPVVHQALATVPGLKRGRTAARETAPVEPVDDAVVEATLPYMPPIVADMVRVERLCGCRPSEVCRLRPCDLDRSSEVWIYRPADHKGAHLGRKRTIFVGPKAQRVLEPYLLRDPAVYCFSPAESVAAQREERRAGRKSPVQPSQRNRRKAKPKRAPSLCYDKRAYQHAVTRAVVGANRARAEEAEIMGIEFVALPHWHPNQLRHSAGTEIRRVFGLEAAQVALGHAKADVTQVYAERDSTLGIEVARRLG